MTTPPRAHAPHSAHRGLLAIGTFARSAGLTINALRHYHDEGLLIPARVDEATGYRYYSPAQLLDAEIVRRLRELDVPVPEVKQVLSAKSAAITRDVLAGHEQRWQQRLADAHDALESIQCLIDQPLALLSEQVTLVDVPEQPVLIETATIGADEITPFFDRAYGSLFERAGREGLTPSGPPGALYPGEEWDPQHFEISAWVPVSGGPGDTSLPGGHFASATHLGSYDTLADSYRAIGVWLADQDPAPGLTVREIYLSDPTQTAPDELLTQILWPLESSDAATD